MGYRLARGSVVRRAAQMLQRDPGPRGLARRGARSGPREGAQLSCTRGRGLAGGHRGDEAGGIGATRDDSLAGGPWRRSPGA